MRKLLLLLLALMILALPITACAQDADTSPIEEVPPPEDPMQPTEDQPEQEAPVEEPLEPVTLVVWESMDGSDEFIRLAGEAFAALYPNVTVEIVNVEIEEAVERKVTQGAGGHGADLFVANHESIAEMVEAGIIQPVLNAMDVAGSVHRASRMAAMYNGIMYGYPLSAETFGLFYNRELIASPPTTFESIMDFSREFNDSAAGRLGFFMNVTSSYYSIIFTTSGDNLLFGNYGTDSHNTNLNTPNSVEGMEFFQELREILDFPADSIDDEMGESGFTQGDIAMYVTGPWNIQKFIDAGVDFGVAPLPSLPNETTPPRTFTTTRNMFVSSFTAHSEEAHAFAEFLTTPQMQELRFELTGELPSVDISSSVPHIQGFLTQLDYGFPMPTAIGMRLYWDIMTNALRNIWGGANVQEELDQAHEEILNQLH